MTDSNAHFTRRHAMLSGVAALAAPAVHAQSCNGERPFRIRRRTRFSSFDPIDTRGEDEVIARNILAPSTRLVRNNNAPSGWDAVPHLAREVSVSSDGLEITLSLGGETWLDRSLVTAWDVTSSFERARDHGENTRIWQNLESVERPTQDTVRLRLAQPDANFLKSVLPRGGACVAARTVTENYPASSFGLNPGMTSGRYLICNPPDGGQMSLAADPSWSGDPLSVKHVQFIVVPDDVAAQAMVASGEIDAIRATPELLFLRSLQLATLQAIDTPASFVRYLAINPNRVQSPALRRAIQLSIDPRSLLEQTYEGIFDAESYARAATSFLPQHLFGARLEPEFAPNPDEAQALVFSERAEGRDLRLAVRPVREELQLAERIDASLRAVGFAPQIVEGEFAQYFQAITDPTDVDLAIIPVSSATLSPTEAATRFTSTNRFAFGFSNAQYDATVQQLPFITDAAQQREVLGELQTILSAEGAYLPLQDVQERWFVNGVQPSFLPDGQIGDLGDWVRES